MEEGGKVHLPCTEKTPGGLFWRKGSAAYCRLLENQGVQGYSFVVKLDILVSTVFP